MKSAWDKRFLQQNVYREKEITFARETLEHAKSGKLLELGCGQGQDSISFADHGFQVTALDWSKEALRSITDKRIKKVCGDMRNLQFDANSFDVVYCVFSIHFFQPSDVKKIMQQVYHILSKGGLFALLAKNTDDKYYGKGQEIAQHTFIYENLLRHFFTEKEIRELLKEFKIISFAEEKHEREGTSSYWKIFAKKV